MSPTRKRYIEEDLDSSLSIEQNMFEQLLNEKYNYTFKKGEIIEGKIVSIESNGYLVDISAKMSAFLSNKEIAAKAQLDQFDLKVGDQLEFFILREEDEEGQMSLSLRRVLQAQNWKKLAEMMKNDTPIDCTITATVKGGLLVDVMGLRGFVPSSQIRMRSNLEELIGQTLPFKILTLDQQRNNIILSNRKVVAEQMAEQRKELFKNIEIGGIVEGEVVRLTDFGAFVDLGGVDGLLPLSQMSWRWVEHPSDLLSIGDKVKVEIIGVDMDRQRVSLSIKSQFSDPWGEVAKSFGMGQEVEGTVTRLKHFGAFVEVYPGVEALLPVKDVGDYEQKHQARLEVGHKITTYILKFSPHERRISLSVHVPYGDNSQDGYNSSPDKNQPSYS
jgi:small subunit ribosomal protein S1